MMEMGHSRILISIVTALLFHSVFGQQAISIPPIDTEIAIGGTTTLYCSISNKLGTMIWKKGTTEFNTDYTMNIGGSRRFSVTTNIVGTEYNLEVSDAKASDSGTYQCTVSASGSDPEVSASAELSVVTAQAITVTPTDKKFQKVSSTATLQCTIANKVGVVQWYRSDGTKQISYERTVLAAYEDRFTITGNPENDEYALHIENIKYDDADDYQCRLVGDNVQPTIWTSKATLSVIDAIPPVEGGPTCVLPQGKLKEGDNITLICRSQEGDPAPTLQWSRGGVDLPSKVIESSHGGTTRVGLQMVLLPIHKGETFTCTLNHVTVSGGKTCSVGPMDIELVPRVSVNIYPDILEVEEGGEGALTCNGTAIDDNPEVTSYDWYYEHSRINDTDKRFEKESTSRGSTLHIVNVEKSMDNAIIACYARSSVDSRSMSSSIKIVELTIFGVSYTFLAVIVALVALVIVVLIVIGVIIYCVWRRREEREDEELRITLRETEKAKEAARNGYNKEDKVKPYGQDDEYDYYIIHSDGRRGRHNRRRRKRQVEPVVGPYPDGDAVMLDRSLPPTPLDIPPPYSVSDKLREDNIYDDLDRDRTERSRRRRRRRDDDGGERRSRRREDRENERRSRSEARYPDNDGNQDVYTRTERRTRRRTRDSDRQRSRSEPGHRSESRRSRSSGYGP
ncbi:uncharacterized protein LOC100368954 [Saccoglossus kowalevskii]|uniref:Obscurin-like n=1 Tax=Saccoglossus kowalevskii TaxID=10224 RepID=A0ABM0GWM7_SACKO|nr:PREDICTED: obscurin-like [Saccoglossus kowalevskii]